MRRCDGPGALAGATGAGDRDITGQRSDTTPRRWTPAALDAGTRATWSDPPATQRPRTIALVGWRPMAKGALRGFATVELPIGLKLIDCPVLVSKGKAWVNVPAKPVLDRDGQQKIEANGKPAYVPVLEWRSRDLADRFSAAVVELVQRAHPGSLDESGS